MWRSFGVVIDTRVFTLVRGTNPPTLFWLAGAVLFRLSAWKLQYFCFTFHQFNSFKENKHLIEIIHLVIRQGGKRVSQPKELPQVIGLQLLGGQPLQQVLQPIRGQY